MKSGHIYNIISEEEFLPLTCHAMEPFFKILNLIRSDSKNLTKKYYSNLVKVAEELETFLDDHGVKENRKWIFFRELIASIRNISISAFELKHTVDRLPDYGVGGQDVNREKFSKEAEETITFLNQSIFALYKSVVEEGKNIGVKLIDSVMEDNDFHQVAGRKQLPKTINEVGSRNHEERVLELSRRYRKVWKIFKMENLSEKRSGDKVKQLIPVKLDEKKAQKLKNSLLNVQSDYDTYVKNSPIEKSNPDVNRFRGYVSIPLHLLEVVRWLLHFYERHEDDIQSGETNVKIARIIDKKELLERMNNFALFYSGWFLEQGNKIAEDIMTAYIKKDKYELAVPQPLGFHARPSTYVSMIVNEHGTDVIVKVEGESFNAKSVLSLMEAGGMIADLGLKKVIFEGDKRVLDDLKILADHNYCEECEIPRPLNYLRIIRNLAK